MKITTTRSKLQEHNLPLYDRAALRLKERIFGKQFTVKFNTYMRRSKGVK